MPSAHANLTTVGLTGGIASGKSTVSAALAEAPGIVVLDADRFGHDAYAPGTACNAELVACFGERILTEDGSGSINRKALGPIVFSDKEKLNQLNRIVWPAIRSLLERKIAEIAAEGHARAVFVEAAILMEAEWFPMFDEVWCVAVPPEVARERLMARNGFSGEEADRRIGAQLSNEERRKRARLEIFNDGDVGALRGKVHRAAEALLKRHSGLSASELVDEVDEHNAVVGPVKRAVVRGFRLRHRATYVVLRQPLSSGGRVYVQRRSARKDYCPGAMDPSPGGVLGTGEDYAESARREMEEEMGLDSVQLTDLGVFFYEDERLRCWGGLFAAEIDVDVSELRLQASEVDAVELMSPEEVGAPGRDWMPDGLFAWRRYLELTAGAEGGAGNKL